LDGVKGEFPQSEVLEAKEPAAATLRVPYLTDADLDVKPPPRDPRPVHLWRSVRELFGAYELLLTLTERDLRVRYKQAFLGALWAILQPLFLMVVFTVVFGRIARVGSEGVPYPIFSYVALVQWGYFANCVNYGTGNIISNAWMIRKVYLPRDILPLSAVFSAFADFVASGTILVVMLFAYGFTPRITWLAYPLLFGTLTLLAVAAAYAVSMVTVYFRDTRYGIPTMLQVLMYATPVAYPLARALGAMPPGWRRAYFYLNPFVPIMDGFRRILIHGQWPQWAPLGAAAAVGLVSLYLAYRRYKRLDPTFADVI